MGTDVQLWLRAKADSLVHDGELLTWVAETKAHLERCRATGEDPFPDAVTIDDLLALLDGPGGGS